MLETILGLLSSAFGSLGSIFDFMGQKDNDNKIRKGYEEAKRADALEEDKVATNKIQESKDKARETKEDIKIISNIDLNDADLSDIATKKELDSIEDDDDRLKRAKEIKAAKELKRRKTLSKKVIESDEKFNSGDDFTFEG